MKLKREGERIVGVEIWGGEFKLSTMQPYNEIKKRVNEHRPWKAPCAVCSEGTIQAHGTDVVREEETGITWHVWGLICGSCKCGGVGIVDQVNRYDIGARIWFSNLTAQAPSKKLQERLQKWEELKGKFVSKLPEKAKKVLKEGGE